MRRLDFLADETGAVTVDWVVMTAALVGLGLAVMGTVSGGIGRQARDTRDMLSGGDIVRTSFSRVAELFGTDFSSGPAGWIGGSVVRVAGFGDVLQLGPNQAADLDLAIPPGSTSATVTFDLIGANDLSGEAAAILIDGREVALYADDHGRITLTDKGVSGVTVGVAQHYANEHMGAGTIGKDSRATYTITVTNPNPSMRLTVASRTGRPISEEFYAIDDVTVTAR